MKKHYETPELKEYQIKNNTIAQGGTFDPPEPDPCSPAGTSGGVLPGI